MKYLYPEYGVDLSEKTMQECLDIVVKLLDECGFVVKHDEFLNRIKDKPGIRIKDYRVHFDPKLTRRYLDEWIKSNKHAATENFGVPEEKEKRKTEKWTVTTAGFSMMVRDVETDEVREGTCQDLRDMIKLVNSYGVGGSYPVMPQDVPPLMRAPACFKICYEMSDNIRPYDYQQPEQTRYIYDMTQVMDKTFYITLCVPTTMTIDPKDIDVFLSFHDDMKKGADIAFQSLSYAMLGIVKPITAPGCATMMLAEKLAVHMLFNLFDPDIKVGVGLGVGHPTDLRNANWAFGSPRSHLFSYLGSRLMPRLCGYDVDTYDVGGATLETSSPALDEVTALEKMANGLIAAMHGARNFGYAGVLCVDDVFSGVQFVIDLEIVNYIREVIESFNPHPDVVSIEGLWEECRDVALGRDTHLSHINTARRVRNVLPSSDRIVRQKLRAWMANPKLLVDRAREEAIERIKTFEPRKLPEDKQQALDEIYARAERALGG